MRTPARKLLSLLVGTGLAAFMVGTGAPADRTPTYVVAVRCRRTSENATDGRLNVRVWTWCLQSNQTFPDCGQRWSPGE